MSVPKPISVRLDDKGRLTLPRDVREALRAQPGDVFFIQPEEDGVRLVRAGNPFDALTAEAIQEDDAGETIALDDILKREGISIDE
ncbi:AbrB/MazE/SpoVT family DNA-binding domain-containing protein [Alicyclobacillus fodiniaquatilis]|uniref:AbrB/MazE/SpoVT family DNA-binding domain-containing protein n=1 Tax=Alicyclobacillus fodiniaquatilis TaxID=1661150 RepID=A0ABW4JEE1_9BACL